MAVSRSTRQKTALEQAAKGKKGLFSAEELHATVKEGSLATTYRYLKEAVQRGELHPYSCQGKQLYATSKRSHCHFICEETGKTIHFDIDNIDFLKDNIPGTIHSFQIEVRGVCTSCSSGKETPTALK